MRCTVLVALAGLAACDGRSAAPSATPATRITDHLLAHLPPDTEAVVGGSLAELSRWPLWRAGIGVIAHDLPWIAEAVATRCGLDPWTVVDAAALAFPRQSDDMVLAAHVSSDRTRLHECLGKVSAAAAQPVRVDTSDPKITAYVEDESTELAAWTGERMVLAVPQRMDERDTLAALIEPRPVPPALQQQLARADRTASLWGVAVIGAEGTLAEIVSGMPVRTKPIGLHGAIHRADGLRAHIAFVFPDAASANDGRVALQDVLASPPPLAPWKDALKVEQRGEEVRLALELSAERARQFDALIIAMLPKPTQPPPKPAEPTPTQTEEPPTASP